jgi:flavin reductase (DIM6/NTAB) family NADH-FMN oxidoreductase RutF
MTTDNRTGDRGNHHSIQGGGGITHGDGSRSAASGEVSDPVELMRLFRRRWSSGVAILTIGERDNWRGITLTAVMPLSLDPPTVAIGLTATGEFAARLQEGTRCGLSILQRDQVFLSERFAGRAPVPDASFTGVPFDLDAAEIPLIRNAAAALSCRVELVVEAGDHLLVLLEVDDGVIGPDMDDPLVSYEGSYRGLEVD